MKSFSILAGLVGLASASNWNETWTHSSSSTSWSATDVTSSSSWVPEHKPTGWSSESSSSSVPAHKPTGWVPESSSSSVPVHKPTGWVPESSSSASVHKPSGWVPESSSSAPSWKPTGWVPEHSSSVSTVTKDNATSNLVTYVTTTVCPATTIISGHTSVYVTTSTLTVTSCKGSCGKPTPTHDLTSTATETTYTTTSLCPVETVKQGHTFTYYSTSTYVVTSCAGGCKKPKPTSFPNVTSTEIVYTSTTLCPVVETTISAGKTLTKTYTTISTVLATSTVPVKHTLPVAPYPVHNATTQGHNAPSGVFPVPAPSQKTKTVSKVAITTITTCSSGEVITSGGAKTTLTAPSVITKTYTSQTTRDLTVTVPTQGHVVPTAPVYSNGTTHYIVDVTTTYLTTCPVTQEIKTGGTTRTSVYNTVSTATAIIKVSKTGSVQIPASSAPSAASSASVEHPVSSAISSGTGKVTVIVPVTQYTTTCTQSSSASGLASKPETVQHGSSSAIGSESHVQVGTSSAHATTVVISSISTASSVVVNTHESAPTSALTIASTFPASIEISSSVAGSSSIYSSAPLSGASSVASSVASFTASSAPSSALSSAPMTGAQSMGLSTIPTALPSTSLPSKAASTVGSSVMGSQGSASTSAAVSTSSIVPYQGAASVSRPSVYSGVFGGLIAFVLALV
ncbi:hypothetical protein D6D28_03758 [Aureobasidium pullulans]|uniref:Uncharacterized protein n=1 Tax=Aureobasidium pullulans TaxID=5580 RepID=A0A4V4I0H5_AURPU|nr:hypothetical protein D6D28_03758 [Aureobasidium pullulans]